MWHILGGRAHLVVLLVGYVIQIDVSVCTFFYFSVMVSCFTFKANGELLLLISFVVSLAQMNEFNVASDFTATSIGNITGTRGTSSAISTWSSQGLSLLFSSFSFSLLDSCPPIFRQQRICMCSD